MPYTPIAFESSRVKESSRKDIREAREKVLTAAKDAHDRRLAKEERARQRGDDKWMLPSLEARLESESSSSKKSKKHKKDKKKKKKKHKKRSSSGSDSSEEEEEQWVEKVPQGESSSARSLPPNPAAIAPVVDPAARAERDEWMTLPGLIPCVTRNELRQINKPAQQREAEEKQKFMLDKPGQSAQELNPFWRDGGSGLPQAPENEELHLPQKAVGDQGVGWLRKALQRVHEQAAETGRSEEDVAAERWGSLEKLKSMLAEAEGRTSQGRQHHEDRRRPQARYPQDRGARDHRSSQDRADRPKDKPRFQRPSDDYDDERRDNRERTSRETFQRDYHNRDTDKVEPRKSFQKSKEELHDSAADKYKLKDKFKKSQDDIEDNPGRSSSTKSDVLEDRKRDDRNVSKHNNYQKDSFQKPKEEFVGDRKSDRRRSDYDYPESRSSSSSGSVKGRFQKPADEDDDSYRKSTVSRSSSSKNWKKREEKPEVKAAPVPPRPRKSSSSSSASSEVDEPMQEDQPEPLKLLSDKEMNDIGAKIVKAEIMGNEALAKDLKVQLESARKAREEAKAAGISSTSLQQEEEVVILTRTDARGFTRPLDAPQYSEPSGGRRKKQKVETHNKDGERVRYFPDDDKYHLQDMFTREKLNTVEDSNHEFAKLVAKGSSRAGKGEYDLDDMFEERARLKEPDSKSQARDREQAMREHQRVSRALDGCRWCLDSKQMLKHLIIAIGSKVYLSLPPFQSLTPGHCLLAPTLHSTCATQLDEDVWAEMQTFRKALTKMFAAKDEDVVFFETARNLRGFPHMVMECVPLDRESGNLAPIYFKKAIQECEMEWSTNKKLVELAGKGVRRCIPKGLPYFAVCFGDDDGFGHVIEDEAQFPHNFAQETIGGILDLDHQLWRKRHNENFEVQRKKVLEFAKDWAPFDFTQKKTHSPSASDSDSD